MSKPDAHRDDGEEFKSGYDGRGVPKLPDPEYQKGDRVDLSEEDDLGRTIPRPMIVESCHLVDGQHMYRLNDLDGAPHKGGKLYAEKKLGLS